MGRNLHPSIPEFIETKLRAHEKVVSLSRIDNFTEDNDYIYLIERSGTLSNIVMHASDEYLYTLDHYFQKPAQITKGGFILIARPEAKYVHSIAEIAEKDKISIGKWGAIMGALYHKKHWEYIPKERKKQTII